MFWLKNSDPDPRKKISCLRPDPDLQPCFSKCKYVYLMFRTCEWLLGGSRRCTKMWTSRRRRTCCGGWTWTTRRSTPHTTSGTRSGSYNQGCGSGLDPDSIGSVDPDPESGPGSRTKMTHKSRKKFKSSCFEVWDGLFFSAVMFFYFWSLKPWIRIGSGSVLVFSLKCWIRIRMKWMRIRSPAHNPMQALTHPSKMTFEVGKKFLGKQQVYAVQKSAGIFVCVCGKGRIHERWHANCMPIQRHLWSCGENCIWALKACCSCGPGWSCPGPTF